MSCGFLRDRHSSNTYCRSVRCEAIPSEGIVLRRDWFSRPVPVTHFSALLDLHMGARRYTGDYLAQAVGNPTPCANGIIRQWRNGVAVPRSGGATPLLQKVELFLQCPESYFASALRLAKPPSRIVQDSVSSGLRWIVRWHLPNDFNNRTPEQRQEIWNWLEANVLGHTTEYAKYIGKRTTRGYYVVFPMLDRLLGGRRPRGKVISNSRTINAVGSYDTVAASPSLAAEMAHLLNFRTAVLPPLGYRRVGRILPVTSRGIVNCYGSLFGALASAPSSEAQGLGVPLEKLTFGLLVFPAVWDWYLAWRQKRRGFFTRSEPGFLYWGKTDLRRPTGWLRQHQALASAIEPIKGLVSASDVRKAKGDWASACDRAFAHVCDRIPELTRAARKHHDQFIPILTVLSSTKPLTEYRKIATEVIRHMPDRRREPHERAVALRAYLMLRFAIHLGFRQRTLRELLLCEKGAQPRADTKLYTQRRGELRWSSSQNGWEVFCPPSAFKNESSSYFRGRPFQLLLPDFEGLYDWIDQYIKRDRPFLLSGYKTTEVFFVNCLRYRGESAELRETHFNRLWNDMIRKYGIYNPYTKRGAIPGLLPHGPHSVRDVIATHVLKETGSYEVAGFAIQDCVKAVRDNYTTFLPHEKAARAAEIMNRAWQ